MIDIEPVIRKNIRLLTLLYPPLLATQDIYHDGLDFVFLS
jgi:hypothetical protein